MDTILSFHDLSVSPELHHDVGLEGANLRLGPGQVALVKLERHRPRAPVADAAQGLVEPTAGEVRFLGESWAQMSASRVADMRGRIGRSFVDGGWVSNLNIDENITLAQRHHTRRSVSDILADAETIGRRLGLDALPTVRPALLRRSELRRCSLVRAFLGQPDLVLLENPLAGIDSGVLAGLLDLVRQAQQRGAAILWTSDDGDLLTSAGLKPSCRLSMSGNRLLDTDSE